MAGNSISTSVLDAEDSRPLANLDFEELAADGGSLGIVLSYLEKQHRIIMDALTYQDEMLRSINHRVEREGSTVPALPEFRFHAMNSGLTNGLGTGSAGSAGSNAVKASKDSAKLRSPGEHSVAASLFTSYSQDDLMLRLGASQAVSPVRSQGQDPTRTKGPTETLVQRITRHVAFDIFFGAVVVTNAIFIGIDVGFHVGPSESRDVSFKVIQYVYTLAFTVEIFFRIGAEWHDGWTCRGEDRAWNCFDLFIVMVAWFEVSIDVIHATTDTQMDSIAGVSSLRAFRIIRLTRILKTAQVIRVLRFVMALRTLVTSILSTLKALFWALLLLFLIIYIFALLFTQAVDEFIFKENKIDQLTPEEASASDQYFGTLFHSMLTLFMSIAGGVSWEDAIAPLMAISTVWLLAFLFYVSFTYFAVLNVEHESLEVPSYVSFASHDLKLKACTDSADAQISRRKFASQKTRSDAGGQKMPNRVATMVQNPAFDAFFGFVVITNAVFIGIDLEMSTSPGTPDLGMYLAFRVVQYLYTFLFTIELLLRIRAADGLTGFMWTDDWHWNCLDIFIVTSSLWEIIVDFTHMLGEQGLGSLAGVSSLKAFRIIRITRVVKTVRVIRLFRFVLKLRTLITSIASTLTSLFWAMILLTLVIYVFAILFAQTVNDYVRHPDMMSAVMTERDKLAAERYFKDLPTTMLSLFMSIAGGVSWEEVIAPLMSISSIWAWVFLFYFFFTYFAVLNVVTAVFCQSAIDSAQSDHTMMVQSILDDKEAHLEKIKALFSQMAYNEEGGITFAMFEEKINSAAVKEYFATLGLDVWDAWSFFKLLDADAGGSVEIEESLMGCLRLRGQATAIDVGKILQDQEFLIKNQDRFFGVLDAELRDLKMELATLRYAASGSDLLGSSGPGPGMARTLDL